MSIETAEELKAKLTDKWVVVDASIPELKRFSGRTGRVKTVNMNCRALVEFDGAADIGWYDIATACLTVVDGPVKKQAPAAEAKPAAAAPAAKKGGPSPLEMARKQGASGAPKKAAGGPSPLEMARKQGAGSAAAPAGEKKLSPLEMARKQGAAGAGNAVESAADAAPTEPAAEAPAEPKKPAAPAGKMSPLDMIRQQGAARRES